MKTTESVFKTKRFVLRPFVLSDAQYLFELNNDPEVIKYTGDRSFTSEKEALQFIKTYDHYSEHGFGRWAVVLKETQSFVGWCGLKYNEEHQIDIGFRFFRRYWNQGFASEVAEATLNYGFTKLKLKRIVGRAASENLASIHLLKKLGMRFVKEANCHGLPNAQVFEKRSPA